MGRERPIRQADQSAFPDEAQGTRLYDVGSLV